MQLLYTLTAYLPAIGGAQMHQHQLAKQLQKRHSIQVISHWDQNRTDWLLGTTLRAPACDRDYDFEGIPIHRLGLSRAEKLRLAPYVPLYYPLMGVVLPTIADTLESHLRSYAQTADLIHNVRIGREGLSYISHRLARKYEIPFVLTPVHHPRWVGWRYRAYIDLYQAADAVIVLTEAEKQILLELGVREERLKVTGHGPILAAQADPQRFLQKHQLTEPIVLFLGQHYRYKGYREVLQAAPLVWKQVPEAQFVFIGPPVRQSERDFTAFPDRRIHRLGAVDLQEKTDALAACTLLCLPSMQESFGGVYTEAWSFGKPVVGGRIPAIRDVVEEGVDGYLVAQDPAEIADRLCQLLQNPTQAAAMGAAGRQKVNDRYSWERLAAQTEQVYRDLGVRG
ncbi:MAG: glycosyltransferase family 4 protein [Leptolyngbyaceae cyanobacterium bins.59]|nr:glycosyltransferase family 4 protein [Leptolyngbyaceae cyanobacterium bins.59]